MKPATLVGRSILTIINNNPHTIILIIILMIIGDRFDETSKNNSYIIILMIVGDRFNESSNAGWHIERVLQLVPPEKHPLESVQLVVTINII